MNKISRAAHSPIRKQSVSDNSQSAQKKTKTASKSDAKTKAKAGPQSAVQTKALAHAQQNNNRVESASTPETEDKRRKEAEKAFYQHAQKQFEQLTWDDAPMLANYFVSIPGGPFDFQTEPYMKK